MKKTGILISLICVLMITQNSSAIWHVGNVRLTAYGVKATIFTPGSPPFMYSNSQSSWVSTAGPYWMQIGWILFPDWSKPQQYYEYCTSPCLYPENYIFQYLGEINWSTYAIYDVHLAAIDNYWCAYINNYMKICPGDLVTAPVEVQALSESHHPWNFINTIFSSVKYQDSNALWRPFDMGLWSEDPPYYVQIYSTDYYQNLRNDTLNTYLPIVLLDY